MFKMVGRSRAIQQGSHGRFTGIGERKVRKGDREVGRKGVEEKERQVDRQEVGKAYPFKRECSECAQEVLLVTEAENISCQDLKGRPVQIPEY